MPDEMLNLLNTYVRQEPTIKVNSTTLEISFQRCREGITFYAVSPRDPTRFYTVLVDQPVVDAMTNGLTVAWVLMCVLNLMEDGVRQDRSKSYLKAKAA